MYLTNYNLRFMPFEPSPDPKFIWLSEKHREALSVLEYGIIRNRGFLLLTGDIGTGKTTLINCFLNNKITNTIVASIPDPDLSIVDFFKLLSKVFNIKPDFDTKGEFLIRFENFLHRTYSMKKKVLLIIDEAQRLNRQLLEQIRLLSNVEKQDEKLINFFFVGQNELYEFIKDDRNKALRQRITFHYCIEPLTESETQNYVKHRLKIAGSEKEIFSPEAVHEIFSFSRGYPRLINTICDRALVAGYASNVKKIDGKIAKECADELILLCRREDTCISDIEWLEVEAGQKTTFTRNSNADANLDGTNIHNTNLKATYAKVYNIKKYLPQTDLNDDVISNPPLNGLTSTEAGINTHKSEKVTSNRNSYIISSKAMIALIEKVTYNIKNQIEMIHNHQNFIELIDKIDFKKGDLVIHEDKVAFKLDFNIICNLGLVVDHKGNFINVYRLIKQLKK